MITYALQGWQHLVDVLSLLFLVATAVNLAFLWHEGSAPRRRKAPSGPMPQSVMAKAPVPIRLETGHRPPMDSRPVRKGPRLEMAVAPVAQPIGGTTPQTPYEAALRMIGQGVSVADVASALRLPKGEIDLFLKLNRRRQPGGVSG